jgi:hypothetical protein
MRVKKEPVWKPSHREEVIAALWFIAAFTGLQAKVTVWLFVPMFVRACMGAMSFIKMAIEENKKTKQNE